MNKTKSGEKKEQNSWGGGGKGKSPYLFIKLEPMNKTQQLLKSREEEFDKEFIEEDRSLRTRMKAMNRIALADGIKSFHATTISLLLNSLKEEIKEIKKLDEEYLQHTRNPEDWNVGYDKAIDDILSLINKTQ